MAHSKLDYFRKVYYKRAIHKGVNVREPRGIIH